MAFFPCNNNNSLKISIPRIMFNRYGGSSEIRFTLDTKDYSTLSFTLGATVNQYYVDFGTGYYNLHGYCSAIGNGQTLLYRGDYTADVSSLDTVDFVITNAYNSSNNAQAFVDNIMLS